MRRRLRVVVTAGPTAEAIDPIRFISNHSTGVMGYAIAREARSRGHRVVLISGPTALIPPRGVRTVGVVTALQMRRAVRAAGARCDALIMAAAVCDWRPAEAARRKLKRGPSGRRAGMRLDLVENPDILLEEGRRKGRRVLIGFALETERAAANARGKLRAKNLDAVIANRIRPGRTVFGECRADFWMIDRTGAAACFRRADKKALARRVIDKAEALCYSGLEKRHRRVNA